MIFRLIGSGYSGKEIVFYLLIMLFALTLSFSAHEFMHAFVAMKLGDPTAQNLGRVTLNPAAHIDPLGALLLLTVGFGWGKPVPYNPNRLTRFKNKRLMCIMVHLAGVTGNFIVAYISSIITLIIDGLYTVGIINENPAVVALSSVFSYTTLFSLGLLAFNLLPIPPLDGFHTLEELLPYKTRYSQGYQKFVRMSPQILLILIILGSFSGRDILSVIISLIELPFAHLLNLLLIPVRIIIQLVLHI